ncbi:chromatin modification-related protein EAF1 B-like isoform X1 [Iris pallida]|uniref:Chromatin modification-related protein EAF1 B-like isoform X1 n=1 Tax=Iris pallida TaxID=29817 RepID=A0AAX6IDH3_IRIPA|nr:chromatin modification-related protein EAF1 B-like isoform X1 [Iris pallida]
MCLFVILCLMDHGSMYLKKKVKQAHIFCQEHLKVVFVIKICSQEKKEKKKQQKSHAARLYDAGSDLSHDPCQEGTSANQGLMFMGKRPSSSLNVCSIPTKRVRTAARQRILSPFSAGVSGSLQVTSKTDVSSGGTNSFQDDQSSIHGGSQVRKNMEVESTVDFERHITSDGIEISTKSKKKKKPKHGGYTMNITDTGVLVGSGKGSLLDQRLQVDSMVQHEQSDHVNKRLEGQHFESNGNIGIYGQHVAKKPKHSKQLTEPSPDVIMPGTGSMASPAASQMSNRWLLDSQDLECHGPALRTRHFLSLFMIWVQTGS